MTKIIELINSLPDLLPLNGATETEITDAELQLGVRFADEYKKYLAEFGAIMADGIELTGISKAEHRNVVSLTERERELNPKVRHLAMYVIENTCIDGIIIWQDTAGSIYRTIPNGEPAKIASSLYEYITQATRTS